jgi:DNA recombination protein RmuC
METSQFYIILGVITAGFIALFYYMVVSGKKMPSDSEAMKVMTEWMRNLKTDTESSRKEIQDSIKSSSDDLNRRLTEAARLFADVQNKVGEMSEIGRGMKDIQDLLKGPKLRGGMGEESLEMTLKQVLPDKAYQMQYRFSTGEIVDCIVRLGTDLICIDSKFPLENFRMLVKSEKEEDQLKFKKDFIKDVKKHIDAISKKYILPNENTMDFALMYVPMESVFQEINNDQETSDYARTKKVYITSPNSFYHYLTIIMNSLKAAQINEMIKPLLRQIAGIKQDSDKFANNLSVLTKHITNAKNTSDSINEEFRKLSSKIENAYGLQLEDKTKVEELPEINLDKIN